MKNSLFFFLTASLVSAAASFAPAATISNIAVRQRWPWSQKVDIDYTLSADDSVRISLAVYSGNTQLTIPEGAISGEYRVVSAGAHTLVFDPTQTAYTNRVLTDLRFVLTATNIPLYMIVDLTKAAGADGQIEYIYPGDPRLETYGRWTNVWFGVTNDSVYATTKLVMRRIHPGTFKMGDNVNISTTLTNDFYAGVFEVTQRQWELIREDLPKPSYFTNSAYYATRPVEQVTYNSIRGALNGVNWPVTDRTIVSEGSFLGKLRAKTGLTDFDLPTEAQWECLCRAGTATVFNDGNASANVDGANANTNTWLNALGRYKFDGGFLPDGVTTPLPECGATNGTAVVGSYQANAWGLYDTHGNVWEWCLDWYGDSLAGGSDPSGAVSGLERIKRGGGFDGLPPYCRSANRSKLDPTYWYRDLGFRLVRTLP